MPIFAGNGDGWAQQTLDSFVSRGLLSFDDAFRGRAAESRWELALSVARLVNGVQSGDLPITNTELADLRRLVADFRTELTELGIQPLASAASSGLPSLELDLPRSSSFTFEYRPNLDLSLRGSLLQDFPEYTFEAPLTSELSLDLARLEVDLDLNDDWTLRSGLDLGRSSTLSLPPLSVGTPSPIETRLTSPFLGVDRQLTENTSVNLDIRYFSLDDQRARPQPGLDGWEVETRFMVRF